MEIGVSNIFRESVEFALLNENKNGLKKIFLIV